MTLDESEAKTYCNKKGYCKHKRSGHWRIVKIAGDDKDWIGCKYKYITTDRIKEVKYCPFCGEKLQ